MKAAAPSSARQRPSAQPRKEPGGRENDEQAKDDGRARREDGHARLSVSPASVPTSATAAAEATAVASRRESISAVAPGRTSSAVTSTVPTIRAPMMMVIEISSIIR